MKKELSKKSINIIHNSASLITEKNSEITFKMYEILFNKYPDLKELFKDAPEDQYMKLADALSAYAVNIDHISILKPALKTIANAHIQAGVKHSHYILVGKSLIIAMEDILGDTATPEFLDAWREAYIYLADTLLDMHNEL